MSEILDEGSRAALNAKMALRRQTFPLLAAAEPAPVVMQDTKGLLHYDGCPEGRLLNRENIRLRWVASDWFEYLPTAQPFGFERSTGQQIVVGRMFTDGGSIPRLAWGLEGFSPWGYGAAYIVHDWLCDLHYCGDATVTLRDATDTMLEIVKTLMEEKICQKNELIFEVLHIAMNSVAASNAWNLPNPVCALPGFPQH